MVLHKENVLCESRLQSITTKNGRLYVATGRGGMPCVLYSHKLPVCGAADEIVRLIRQYCL